MSFAVYSHGDGNDPKIIFRTVDGIGYHNAGFGWLSGWRKRWFVGIARPGRQRGGMPRSRPVHATHFLSPKLQSYLVKVAPPISVCT